MTTSKPPQADADLDETSEDAFLGADDGADQDLGGAAERSANRRRYPWSSTAFVVALAVAILVSLALLSTGGDPSPSDETSAESAGSDSAGADGTAPADGIFALPFTTYDGGTATLADYHGEPLVVNFFASWCPPCRAELPDFEATHQRLGSDVTFLGVNQDFTEDTWRAFVAESQVTYDTVFQPQSEIWTEVATQTMPTTMFIAADGEIQQVWAGLITEEKLEELINENLLELAS